MSERLSDVTVVNWEARLIDNWGALLDLISVDTWVAHWVEMRAAHWVLK
jgi:hypothetical protein